MIGYYLGVRVAVEADLGGGWCSARWPDGKVWRHWRTQIKQEPWR